MISFVRWNKRRVTQSVVSRPTKRPKYFSTLSISYQTRHFYNLLIFKEWDNRVSPVCRAARAPVWRHGVAALDALFMRGSFSRHQSRIPVHLTAYTDQAVSTLRPTDTHIDPTMITQHLTKSCLSLWKSGSWSRYKTGDIYKCDVYFWLYLWN